MTTNWTSRPSVTTSYSGRDPVGRKYLSTEDGKIITTESGAWIIAIDSSDTAYTLGRQPYIALTWGDLGTWDSLTTWDAMYSGQAPTLYTSRPII